MKIILALVLILMSVFNSYSQSSVKTSYQGFQDEAFTFFIKNCNNDTIEIKDLYYFSEYNTKCKCYMVRSEYYTIKNNVLTFDFQYFENTPSMYISDIRNNKMEIDNKNNQLNPYESFGFRLYPEGLKKRNVKNYSIQLILTGINKNKDVIKIIYPEFDCYKD